MARKSVFIERSQKDIDVDNAVATAKDVRDIAMPPDWIRPINLRAFLSQTDFNRFKAKCAVEGDKGVSMSAMLGDLIRTYLGKE